MNPALILKALEELVDRMPNETKINRVIMYSAVNALVDKLREVAPEKSHGPAKVKIVELLWSCASMADLDDGNGHTIDQHRSWASMAIDALKSVHYFDVK